MAEKLRRFQIDVALGWKAQTIYESEMALFSECMQGCARKVLDTADIVRDGDFSPTISRRPNSPLKTVRS